MPREASASRPAMTIDKAKQLQLVQARLGSGYNRNVARLIREIDLEHTFGPAPGSRFSSPGR